MSVSDVTAAAKEVRALQSLQRLSHPNLLRIERVWSMPGYVAIAMELADGSLFDLLEAYITEFGKTIEPKELCAYLAQAASALDFLNARRHQHDGRTVGFQHCDVKPSNLLVLGDKLKLADYGLATPTVASMIPYSRWATLDFAAPEIFRGHLSERADQFSLAVSYYFLRTATFPFPAPPPRADRTYVRPAPDLSRLTDAERPVVQRALSTLPDDRWPTCSMFLRVLMRAQGLPTDDDRLEETKPLKVPNPQP
jgi:serine/threonine protein kinase